MLSVLPLRVPVLEADAGSVALEADYLRSAAGRCCFLVQVQQGKDMIVSMPQGLAN